MSKGPINFLDEYGEIRMIRNPRYETLKPQVTLLVESLSLATEDFYRTEIISGLFDHFNRLPGLSGHSTFAIMQLRPNQTVKHHPSE